MKRGILLACIMLLTAILTFGGSCANKTSAPESESTSEAEIFIAKDGLITGLTNIGKTQKELEIPAEINGQKITRIWQRAFEDNFFLTSVTICDGIENIDDYAFSGCIALTTVVIPDSVSIIGDEAFSNCNNLTSVTIGKGVGIIDFDAFADCFSLSSVTYTGTTNQWERISCYHDWATNTSLDKINCIDGEITVEKEGDTPTRPKN